MGSGTGVHGGFVRIAGRTRQKFLERGVIYGRGVEIALAKFAAELFDVGVLARGFDAFGNHFEVEMMSERDDEASDFTAFDIMLDTANEGAIDL